MAVGLEGTHAQLLGHGEGLVIVGFGLCDIGGGGVGMDGIRGRVSAPRWLTGRMAVMMVMAFGALAALPGASRWQAKEPRPA